MNNLGGYAYWAGRWDEARSWYERAREVYLDTGNIVDAGFATANLGEILLAQGYLADAEKVLHEALRGFRASGVRSQVAFVQNLLAAAAARAYRFDEAETLFKEVAAACGEMGDAARITEVEALSAESLVLQGKGRRPRRRPKHSSVPIPRIRRRLSSCGSQATPWPRSGSARGQRRSCVVPWRPGTMRSMRSRSRWRPCCAWASPTVGRGRNSRRERDALFERLGIVAVPDVPSAAIA